MPNFYYDMEFTGLVQNTELISLGCWDDKGRSFYAEVIGYDESKCDKWIQEHVEANLIYKGQPYCSKDKDFVRICDLRTNIIKKFLEWIQNGLEPGEQAIMVCDCYAYDWVLLNDMWGGALNVPEFINYIPTDLSTMLRDRGYDPDINREYFCKRMVTFPPKHNSLMDAQVIRDCYHKLIKQGEKKS